MRQSRRPVRRVPLSEAPLGARLRWRLRYVIGHAFEAAVGLAAAVGGVTYFLNLHSLLDSSVGQSLRGLVSLWSALYVLGGFHVVWGLVTASLRAELVGLCLLLPATATEGIAILLFAGTRGAGPGVLFLMLAAATCVRGTVVWRIATAPRVGP